MDQQGNQEHQSTQNDILLVDDEIDLLNLYKEILELEGLSVDTASDGKEALRKAEARRYSLILLDINMNEYPDGIEVLRIIRSDKEKYGDPVIVMLTNIKITEVFREAFELGADGYLVKLALTSNEQLVRKVKGFLYGFQRS